MYRIISTHKSQTGNDKVSVQTNRIWAVCMEVYSDRLFVLLNPTDPPQNPFSTTQGSVSGLRQALTGGTVRSTDKVTVWHKGPVWVMLKNIYKHLPHSYTHTKFQVLLCVSLLLFLIYFYTNMMTLHMVH